MRLLAALADLVLPGLCAGCAAPGSVVCASCAATLAAAPRRARPEPCPGGLPPCWAAADYDGPVRELLLAYKERGHRALGPGLGAALARAVGDAVPCGSVTLVPVPSTAAAVRARGGDHVYRLARAAADALRAWGWEPQVARLLVAAGARRDSAGLDATQRRDNRAGAFRARPSVRPHHDPTSPVVLVDDLVTTGATLAEGARVLRAVQVGPLSAAVVAATVRRRSRHRLSLDKTRSVSNWG
jgi:predicted amidophosphoribosyltransferase